MRAAAKGVVTKPTVKVSNKAATIKEAKVELYGVRLGQIHKSKKIIEINNLLINLTYTKLITQNQNEFTAFTKAAVQSFQCYIGMNQSGTVGPLTLGKLRTAVYLKNHNKNWKVVEHVDKIYEILEGFIWDGPINYAKNIKDTIELIANPNAIISLVHVLSNVDSAKQFLANLVVEGLKGIVQQVKDFINGTGKYKAAALSQFLIDLAVSKGIIGKGFKLIKTSLKIAVKIEKAMKIAKKFSIDKLKAAAKKLRIRTFKKGEKEAVSIEEELCKKEGGKCFTGDTLVKTKEGNKKIKDIRVGDYVYSENVETGEKGYNKVINVFVRTTREIVHVFVGNEEIKATSEHPFWKYEKGWIGAGELKVNDEILTADGNRVRISDVKKEYFENEPVKVYNFEVENNHSYFVSGIGVLVHNADGDDYGRGHNWITGNLINKINKIGNRILDYFEDFTNPKRGHTIQEHCSKTNNYLIDRANDNKHNDDATTYVNKSIANKAVLENLRKHAEDIEKWLSNSENTPLHIRCAHKYSIGKGVKKGSKNVIYNLKNSFAMLVKDPSNELGFRIITSYPEL